MANECEIGQSKLLKTVSNWHCARVVFSEFIESHPELGIKNTPITFRNFCSKYGP